MFTSNKSMGVLDICRFAWGQAVKGFLAGKMGTICPILLFLLAQCLAGVVLSLLISAVSGTPMAQLRHHTPVWGNGLIWLVSVGMSAYFIPVIYTRCYAFATQNLSMGEQAWSLAKKSYGPMFGFYIVLYLLAVIVALVIVLIAMLGIVGNILSALLTIFICFMVLPWFYIVVPSIIFDGLSVKEAFAIFPKTPSMVLGVIAALIVTILLPFLVIFLVFSLLHFIPILGIVLIILMTIAMVLLSFAVVTNFSLAIYHNYKVKTQGVSISE